MLSLKRKFAMPVILLSCFYSSSLFAAGGSSKDGNVFKELGEMYVTTASKKTEEKFKAATAISVITHEDIRRSGASNIPEALRLVPGVNVAQIDSSKWAVSVRGFNRQYTNKLLVLIDGRSVYNPLVSGVFWNEHEMILADIDRIEVIRGSGASLWGANAVNGVINIITKKAQTTQGQHVSLSYSNNNDATLDYRYGGRWGDHTFYRTYMKLLKRDEFTSVDGGGNSDDWDQYRGGFRLDSDVGSNTEFSSQGGIYYGKDRQTLLYPGAITPAATSAFEGDEFYKGGNLMARWERRNLHSSYVFQSYVDYTERYSKNLLDQKTLTFDMDYQHNLQTSKNNDLVWGIGYRFIWDHIEGIPVNGNTYLFYRPVSDPRSVYSAFIQNSFDVVPDKLNLTLGTKIEHNGYTGFELQPNARLSWYPSSDHVVWGAISRSVRTPTRGEHSLSSIALSTSGGFARLSADSAQDFESENLTSFELGHRYKASERLVFDTAVFYSLYDDLRTFEPGTSDFNLSNTAFELIAQNLGYAEALGGEIELKYLVTDSWTLVGNYSYVKLNMSTVSSSNDMTISSDENRTPEHNFTLLSRLNLPNDMEWDVNLKRVDDLETFSIPAYTRLDTRIGWKPREGVEVSLIGHNLLDSAHPEFQPFLYTSSAEVDRSVFVRLNLNF